MLDFMTVPDGPDPGVGPRWRGGAFSQMWSRTARVTGSPGEIRVSTVRRSGRAGVGDTDWRPKW